MAFFSSPPVTFARRQGGTNSSCITVSGCPLILRVISGYLLLTMASVRISWIC